MSESEVVDGLQATSEVTCIMAPALCTIILRHRDNWWVIYEFNSHDDTIRISQHW